MTLRHGVWRIRRDDATGGSRVSSSGSGRRRVAALIAAVLAVTVGLPVVQHTVGGPAFEGVAHAEGHCEGNVWVDVDFYGVIPGKCGMPLANGSGDVCDGMLLVDPVTGAEHIVSGHCGVPSAGGVPSESPYGVCSGTDFYSVPPLGGVGRLVGAIPGACGIPADPQGHGGLWVCVELTTTPEGLIPTGPYANCARWVWTGTGAPTVAEPPVTRRVTAGSSTPVTTGAPPSAVAVLANLSMVDGVAPGYITADKCTALVPGPQTRANGNHGVKDAIGNLSVVPVDPDGRFCIYNQVAVNLIADIQGSFAPPAAGGLVFVSTPPTRKLDTRIAPLSKPAAGSITKVPTGVPAGTTSVLVNLAMVDGDGPGYITADKCSALVAGPQTKANGNFVKDTAIGNLSVVPVDTDGSFCVYNYTSVNVIADLQGYFTTADPNGLKLDLGTPARKLDTRVAPLTTPAAGSITKVATGAPAGSTAALVNIAMVDGTGAGYITADRCSTLTAGPQTKANGNHLAGLAIANLSVVPLDPDGSFCIYNQTKVNLVVDLQGSFSPTGALAFYPTAPHRVLDTRN